MRVTEAASVVEDAIRDMEQVLLLGPPGVGKSQLPEDACARLNADFFCVSVPLTDPAFWMGFPYRENGHASFAPFSILAKCLAATKRTVLLIDEVGMGSTETIKAMVRFVQYREVGDKRLPNCVSILGASNDVHHGAGVMGLIEPMKSKFKSIVEVEPNLDDSVVYGLANGWPADMLAFLRNAPDSLMDWKPGRTMQQSGSNPRAWDNCARLVNKGWADKPTGQEVVCGCVGKASGTKYMAFRGLIKDLPDIDGVILSPDSAPVPENPSARFLITMALASRLSAGNFGQVVTYLRRLPQTFRALTLLDAIKAEDERRKQGKLPKDYKPIHTSRDFAAWACSEDGKEIVAAR